MKNAYDIVVKSNFTAPVFTQFRDACEQENISQSRQIFNLAADWVERRNDRRRSRHGGRPELGQKMGAFLPGRMRNGRAMSMRL